MDEADNNVAIRTKAELFTDPGTVAIIGFIVLLIGMWIVVLNPSIKDIYMPFSLGVVGLVGGHAWTDAKKTQAMCEK